MRPSLSGVSSPLALVILNCAPDSGCFVTLSYFSTTRFPLGVLVTMTVWVSPLAPMTTLVLGASITYPAGAFTSVKTYAPGARLVMRISPLESVVNSPFWVSVLVPITPSRPTSQPAAVVMRNCAPARGWPVRLSLF